MPDSIKNVDADLILRIFREEIDLDEDELKEKLEGESGGSRRNERSKIQKQIKNHNLEWKYTNALIQYTKDNVYETPWDKMLKYKNRIRVLENKLNSKETFNEIQMNEEIKKRLEESENEKILELRNTIESLRRNNERYRNANNELSSKVIDIRDNYVSIQKYNELQEKHIDFMSLRNPPSSGPAQAQAQNSNTDDGFKQKFLDCKRENIELKKQITSLEEENLQLISNA